MANHGLSTAGRSNKDTPNLLFRFLLRHYGNNKAKLRSESQLSSEKWLFPLCSFIPFNRWMCMPAAILMQFCVGSLYAFSVLNKPIEMHIYGEIRNISPIAFYIACGCLGLCTAVMGPWVERNGPKVACLLGTALFCSGHFVTALAVYLQQIYLIFIGYGILGGAGIGLCYITPISALQKWFPDHRGLASGFAICGFGAGAIVLAKVQIILIDSLGLPLVFLTLGLTYLVIMTLCSLVMRSPPPDFSVSCQNSLPNDLTVDDPEKSMPEEQQQQKITLVESLQSKDFRLIYVAFIASVIFGLCAMSRLSNMATDIFGKDPSTASTVVSINGGFNLGGRVGFAFISDYIGRKNCFVMMLTIQFIMVASFSVITINGAYIAFVATMWISTACYGGISAVIPALLTDRFGAENVGACVGIQMSGWSFAAVAGGLIFTAVFDAILASGYTAKDPYPYNVNSWWILVIVFVGWISLMCLKPTEKDLKFWRGCRQLFRKKTK